MVLCLVRGIDLVIQSRGGLFHKGDILLDATRLDMAFMALQNATKPGAIVPFDRADIQIVAEANDPYDHQASQRAVEAKCRNFQLFG